MLALSVHVYVCMNAYVYQCITIYMCVCMNAYVYLCITIYMCVCDWVCAVSFFIRRCLNVENELLTLLLLGIIRDTCLLFRQVNERPTYR